MGSKLSADRLIGGGKDDVWTFGSPGVGFGLLGSVSVQHPELDEACGGFTTVRNGLVVKL